MPLFAPFACYFIFELPGTSVESFARLHVKTTIALFLYYTETTRTTYDTRYRYQVFRASSSSQQVPRSYCWYEKGDAVRIEPRPPSPNTCRLCARNSRTLFRPQASGDSTRMQGVLGESRASCQLSINSRAGSNSGSQQQHSARGSSTTPDDGSHIHRIVRPRCRNESSWRRAGRVWACTRPLQSVHAAAELVCRGRVVVLLSMSTAAVGRVLLLCIIVLVLHM